MKSFKIREGIVHIDGVLYGQNPNELKVKGKVGNIHSINIPNKGQFFPIGGEFIDDTLAVTDDSTGIVEETKPIKKTRKTK
jgi:hypothetical protein